MVQPNDSARATARKARARSLNQARYLDRVYGRFGSSAGMKTMSAARKLDSEAFGAERQLRDFIEKFEPKDQRLIHAVRSAVRKRFPTATELVWDTWCRSG
jgi:hypothetical protein